MSIHEDYPATVDFVSRGTASDINAAQIEVDGLLCEAALLREALGWFVENETSPCSFDHHGVCQEHSNADVGCCVADARKLLGLETA